VSRIVRDSLAGARVSRIGDPYPWQRVQAYAIGKTHTFRAQTLPPIRCRKTGTTLPLRVVVIAPVGYRLTQAGKLRYGQPADPIWTDPDLGLEPFVQGSLWRWDIEVFFRVLKSGCRVEARRFEHIDRWLACVAVYLIVAWRTLYVCRLGRSCPDISCESVFEPAEWKSVWKVVQGTDPPRMPPPLGAMIRLGATGRLRQSQAQRPARPADHLDRAATHAGLCPVLAALWSGDTTCTSLCVEQRGHRPGYSKPGTFAALKGRARTPAAFSAPFQGHDLPLARPQGVRKSGHAPPASLCLTAGGRGSSPVREAP